MSPSQAPTCGSDAAAAPPQRSCGECYFRVLLLILVVRVLVSGALSGMVNTTLFRVDFNQLYRGADRLNHGEPLYRYKPGELFPYDIYIYPPAPAMILRPLAKLAYPKAVQLWFYINLGSLLAGVAIYARAARHRWNDSAAIILILVMAFRFWPTTMNFGLGQINCVIFAILAVMYWAVSRNKLFVLAGAIAAAAMIKTWVIGFALYFVIKRKWPALAACTAIFAAALIGCFACIGFSQVPDFLHLSSAYSIQPYMRSQSIVGVAMLHFAKSQVRIQEDLLATNWLDNALLFWGFIVAGYAIVMIGLATIARRAGEDSPTRRQLEFGIIVSSVLLLMPLCQSEYFLFCLPLIWTLLIPAQGQRHAVPILRMIAATAVYLLWTRGFDWLARSPVDHGHASGARSLFLSEGFATSLLLWLTAVWVWNKVVGKNANLPPATDPI